MDRVGDAGIALLNALLATNGTSLVEDHLALRVFEAKCDLLPTFQSLRSLNTLMSKNSMGSCYLVDSFDDTLDISSCSFEDIANGVYTLVIQKATLDDFFYFFSIQGLKEALTKEDFLLSARRVWVCADFQPFSTYRTCFLPWGADKSREIQEWSGLCDARKLVTDLTDGPNPYVPKDIRPWLLGNQDEFELTDVSRVWLEAATWNLSFCLPKSIVATKERKFVMIDGGRRRELELQSNAACVDKEIFFAIHEAALWIYRKSEEAETKHMLYNIHLSMECPENVYWPCDGTSQIPYKAVLRNAKDSFHKHLYEVSKDTLKTLADLRKTLHEDVQRIISNTRTLVTNLWRDLIIALGVLFIRFSKDASKLPDEWIIVLVAGVCIFLILSISFTFWTNRRFNKILQSNRIEWRHKLYAFIDQNEFEKLASSPIEKATFTYRIVCLIVFFIYLFVVWFLFNQIYPQFVIKFASVFKDFFTWLFVRP